MFVSMQDKIQMSTNEKLQKAIEAAITAGYQLNSEAFEFLRINSDSADPIYLMNLALETLANMKEKPFFIEKIFLEALSMQMTQAVAEQETAKIEQEKQLEPPIKALQNQNLKIKRKAHSTHTLKTSNQNSAF